MRWIATLIVAASSTTVLAAEISPEAAPVLDRMLNWYGEIDGAQATLTQTMPVPGQQAPLVSKTNVAAMKPNFFSIRGQDSVDGMSFDAVSNGTTVWEAFPEAKVWAQHEAPKNLNIEGVGGALAIRSGAASIVLDLLSTDSRKSLLEDFETFEYIGKKGNSDQLRVTPKGMGPNESKPDVRLTIGPDGTPWLQEIAMTMPAGFSSNSEEVTVSMIFHNWQQLKKSPETLKQFAFTPGKDWKKVDDLDAAMLERFNEMRPGEMDDQGMGGEGPGGPPHAAHPMVGKPAPTFELPDLNDKTISLASLKGKTVILDFWATWCGPCKQGLPVLMEVAKARAKDGVVLWSVDLGEKKNKVSAFLTKSKWTLNVMLDAKNTVASKYGVRGIPHTVVIDPAGTVRLVEVGFSGKANTKKAMNAIIDEIIAAKTNEG